MPKFDLQSLKQLAGVGTVFHAASMPSTNDTAKQQLLSGNAIDPPLLVLCDHQTAGRGQPGRSWASDSQSLTFTWCLAADSVPTANQPLLPLIAGFCVCEAIESMGVANTKLKWPNDVLVDRKKVCGILTEKIPCKEKAFFLVGIGINVNQSAAEVESFDCSKSRFPASSLSRFTGREIAIQNLLENVINSLHQNVSSDRNWSRDLETRFEFLGQNVKIKTPNGEVIAGVFRGINESGQLRIERENTVQIIASGQIEKPDTAAKN